MLDSQAEPIVPLVRAEFGTVWIVCYVLIISHSTTFSDLHWPALTHNIPTQACTDQHKQACACKVFSSFGEAKPFVDFS